jgi:two-component system, cell cycle response regulator
VSASRSGMPDSLVTPVNGPVNGPIQGPVEVPSALAPGAAELRVILVGRTGLDGTVRGLGPVRVRRALDAIGELADPLAHGAQAAVIVGAEAGLAGAGQDAEFVRALRRVDPAVRVLCVGAPGEAALLGTYDGVVRVDDSLDELMRAMLAEPAGTPVALAAPVTPAAAAPVEVAVESVIDTMLEAPAPGAELGDAGLVGLVLRGADPLAAALGIIRERVGDGGVSFTAAGRAEPANATEVAGPDGHRFGWLSGGPGASEGLAPHARWLGAWLALAAQQSQLRQAAFTDPLTGAWNRRYFDRFLGAAIRSAQSDRRHLTVLVFDIDDFKKYNDQFGHAAGDSILTETVRLLRSVIRPEDKVCRIGGDEFAVIFHEPDGPREPMSKPPESIHEIAQRFQRQVCGHKFPKLGEQAPGTLTISGGLATFPWDGRTAEELLARADELALRAKRAGKNTMVLGPGAEGAG